MTEIDRSRQAALTALRSCGAGKLSDELIRGAIEVAYAHQFATDGRNEASRALKRLVAEEAARKRAES